MRQALKQHLPAALSGALLGFAGVTLLRAVGGLIILKLMALSFTPDIFGRFGQLMAFVAIVTTFAGGGTTQALVQSLASAQTVAERQQRLSAALKIFLGTGGIITLLLVVFSSVLAEFLLGQRELAWLFWVLAAAQWLVGASNIVQVILSAMRRTQLIVIVQGVGILLAVVQFAVLIHLDGLQGAALGIVLFPAAIAMAGLVVGLIRIPVNWRPHWGDHQREDLHSLLSFMLVVLVNICAVPVAQLAVRDVMGEQIGWSYVGYWQAVIKISDLYIQFIGMLMTYYALPRFSAFRTAHGLQQEISHLRRPLMLLVIGGFVIIYLLRHFLIALIFAADYTPAQAYILPQLIGDALRILALFYVYAAMARGERWLPILFEISQGAGLFALSYAFLPLYGPLAPAYGYMVGCVVSLGIIFGLHRYKMAHWQPRAA